MGRKKWRRFAAAALLLAVGLSILSHWAPDAVETEAVTSAPDGPKLIALTFDDGPRRLTTTRLLDGLEERGVRATFFLIGKQIAENEDLVLRMETEGHQVGIHTYDHVSLKGLTGDAFDRQVDRTRQTLRELLGREDFPLRPPYGMLDEAGYCQAQAPVILWSVDPEDWDKRDAGQVADHIVQNAKDGSVVLLHDIYPESVDAALLVIDQLSGQGYQFVTVSELFAARGMDLVPGKPYRHAYPDDPGQWYP